MNLFNKYILPSYHTFHQQVIYHHGNKCQVVVESVLVLLLLVHLPNCIPETFGHRIDCIACLMAHLCTY